MIFILYWCSSVQFELNQLFNNVHKAAGCNVTFCISFYLVLFKIHIKYFNIDRLQLAKQKYLENMWKKRKSVSFNIKNKIVVTWTHHWAKLWDGQLKTLQCMCYFSHSLGDMVILLSVTLTSGPRKVSCELLWPGIQTMASLDFTLLRCSLQYERLKRFCWLIL